MLPTSTTAAAPAPAGSGARAVLSLPTGATVSVCAAVTGGIWALTSLHQLPDPTLFTVAGRVLLSSQGLGVFSDPQLQVGPAYLAFVGVLTLVASVLHLTPELLVAVVASAVIGLGTVVVTRQALALQGRRSATVELGAGLTVVLASPLCAAAWGGHFEELLTALMLLAAAHCAGRDRLVWCGMLIGLAASTKMWGLLGVGLLLIDTSAAPLMSAARLGRLARGAMAMVAVVLAAYLPFLSHGDVATLTKTWSISFPAPVALLADGSAYSFGLRAGQALCAIALGAALALAGRRDVRTLWSVPAAVIGLRLLLDPFLQSYYLAAALLVLAVGVWSMDDSAQHVRALAVSATMPVVWAVFMVVQGAPGSVVTAILLVVSVAAVSWIRVTAGLGWGTVDSR
ncbi:MAG: hypothetical protein WAN48_06000 [Actinomycetes bacterium]